MIHFHISRDMQTLEPSRLARNSPSCVIYKDTINCCTNLRDYNGFSGLFPNWCATLLCINRPGLLKHQVGASFISVIRRGPSSRSGSCCGWKHPLQSGFGQRLHRHRSYEIVEIMRSCSAIKETRNAPIPDVDVGLQFKHRQLIMK